MFHIYLHDQIYTTHIVFSSYFWYEIKFKFTTTIHIRLPCHYCVYYFDEEAAMLRRVPRPVGLAYLLQNQAFSIGSLQ